jgi:hypothetical protein
MQLLPLWGWTGDEDDDGIYTSWLHSRWSASSAAAAAANQGACAPAPPGFLLSCSVWPALAIICRACVYLPCLGFCTVADGLNKMRGVAAAGAAGAVEQEPWGEESAGAGTFVCCQVPEAQKALVALAAAAPPAAAIPQVYCLLFRLSRGFDLNLHVHSVTYARLHACSCVRACTETSPGQLGRVMVGRRHRPSSTAFCPSCRWCRPGAPTS